MPIITQLPPDTCSVFYQLMNTSMDPLVHDLSNGAIFSDLELLLTQISRVMDYSVFNILETI